MRKDSRKYRAKLAGRESFKEQSISAAWILVLLTVRDDSGAPHCGQEARVEKTELS